MGTTNDQSVIESRNEDALEDLASLLSNGDIDTTTAELLALQLIGAGNPEDRAVQNDGAINMVVAHDHRVNMTRVVSRITSLIGDAVRVNATQATRSGMIGSISGSEVTTGPVLDETVPFVAVEGVHSLSPSQQRPFREILDAGTFTFTGKDVHETVPVTGGLLFTAHPNRPPFDVYDSIPEQTSVTADILHGVDLVVHASPGDVANTNGVGGAVNEEIAESIADAWMLTPGWSREAEVQLDGFTDAVTENGSAGDSTYVVTAPRLRTTVQKFSEALARLHGSETVTAGDVERVTTLISNALSALSIGWGTAQIPPLASTKRTDAGMDRQSTGDVQEIIERCESESENGAPVVMIYELAPEHGIAVEEIESEIETLKQKGEVYQPADGYLRTT